MAHPQTSFPAFPSTLRRFGRRPWLTLLGILALLGVVGGVIFASGTTTVIVELATVGNIPESAGNARFIVRLSDPIADGAVQITVRTVNGTGANGATAGNDFTFTEQTFTFTVADQGPRDFLVPIIDDPDDELNETFSVELYNLNNTSPTTVFLGQPFTAVIEDNDSPTLVSITGPATVDEGAGVVNFTVTMAESSPQPVTFQWQIVGAGANPITLPPAPGADIASAGGTWIIPANSPAGPSTFSVGIINDILPESDEQFELRITNVTNVANPSTALAVNILVTIRDDDDPPVIDVNTGLTVAEGGSGTIGQANLQASDVQQGPAQLTFTLTTAPANGTLFRNGVALNVGNTFTQADINANLISYTHNDSETTSDSFAFTVSDGFTPVGPASFTITVTPVNDPPVFDPDTYSATIPEDTAAGTTVVSVTANDPDNDPLTYSITAGNTGNAFTIDTATGAIRVSTPSVLDFETLTGYTLTVSVFDGELTDTATVTITITNVNEPPIAGDDTYTVTEDTTLNIDTASGVLDNDTDVETPAALVVSAVNGTTFTGSTTVTTTEGGTLFMHANGSFDYTPAADFFGADSFTYTVGDPDGATDTATVTINVTNVNDPPAFSQNTYSVSIPEDTAAGATVVTVTANDPDNDPLTYSITTGNTGNAFTIDTATGAIRVSTPSVLDFETLNGYTLTVSVFDGELTDTTTVTITITNVNEPPAFDPDTYSATIPEDTAAGTTVVTVTANDPDAGTTLIYSITAGNTGSAFTIDPVTGAIRVSTPSALDFEIQASYTLTVTVSDGNLTDTATVTINITNVNEPPQIAVNTGLTVDEGAEATIGNTLLAAKDVDNTPDERTFLVLTAPLYGELRLNGSALAAGDTFTQADIDAQRLSYAHDDSETPLSDSFQFVVTDPDGASAGPATFAITITPVNDRPVVDANGSAPGINYSVPTAYAEGQATPLSIVDPELTVTDDDTPTLATVVVTIDNLGNGADEELAVDAATASAEGITASYAAANGTLTLSGPATLEAFENVLRTLTYSNSAMNPGTARTISIVATDTGTLPAASNPATLITLTITPTFSQPTLINTGLTVNSGTTANLTPANLSATDPDTVAADLVFTITTAPANGQLRRNNVALGAGSSFTQADIADGLISYTHDGSATTSDSFGFSLTDGDTTPLTGTFAITVIPGNNAPVIVLTPGATTYVAGAPAVVIDGGALVSDADSSNFADGELRVTLSNGSAGDVLGIRNQGNGAGQIGVSGNTVSYGGVAIGTFVAGSNSAPLVVSLNANATPAAAEALARNITFVNTLTTPVGGSRTATFTLSDGDGGTSAPASKVITVETPITPPPPQQFTLYLPLQGLVTTPAAQPDLEVSAISVNPAAPQAGAPVEVRVTVRNSGNAPASNFWVDFYINPTRAPGVNDPWNELCALDPCFGMAWFYTGTLAPGESVVLLSRPQDAQTPNGFVTASSIWPGFFANGTSKLYAVVDSWNRDTTGGVRDPNGAVIEHNETNNRAEADVVVTPGALPQAHSFPAPISLPERTGVR